MTKFRAIGRPVPREDGRGKVTGQARFTADVVHKGTLWGKILRSPLPHARILRIDTSRAKKLRGVKAVITAQDVSSKLTGRTLKDLPVLARDRVRFVGDKIAAVAAIDKDIAEEAVRLIEAEYEELPAVFDPLEALKPESPLLHPDYASYHLPETKAVGLHNVQTVLRAKKGDLEQGLGESDRVFEHTFRTQMVHQGYIEPYACSVEIDGEGRVLVWASTQSPFSARDQLAELLDLPKERVIFHPVAVGGSFGGKDHLIDIPIAYYLARAAGSPVRIVRTYAEELMASAPRHPSVIFLRTGVKSDGRLWAREARVIYNGGAYGAFKPSPQAHMSGALTMGGAYRIPHTRLESMCVYTNQVPGGYMRASGELQTVFAVETHMDIIAHELGIDPLEFRLLNALQEGDSNYAGFQYRDIKCREVLERARQVWTQPKLAPRKPQNLVGRGIAFACRHIGQGESEAEVLLGKEGNVRVVVGIVDQGAGVHVMQKQVVAEVLGIAPERVTVEVLDTSRAPYHDAIKGQGSTHVTGQAVSRATQALIESLRARAAIHWGADPADVRWRDGRVWLNGRRSMDLKQLAALAPGEPGRGFAYYDGRVRPREHIFQAVIADVEVDRESGKVEVRRLSSFHDVSVVINPLTHQGQIEGGMIQGLGMALCEEVKIEDGRVITASLGDYKLPTARDIPPRRTILVEGATHGPGPFNAKPAAEHAITPVAPAIGNALFNASGMRMVDLPFTAEKVYRAMHPEKTSAQEAGHRR
ncbi:MAG TPA: xanthine dehydrogenase family protein molybdopterin-binding subunit [Candidatus Acidoferrales bacterium]|nr:xanthine dehydrogenase family protein molybdopterin-binding subunit [Candidatus Acidoferrales bacterium]